jgi:protein-tyrosine-phosphatase
MKLAGNRIVWLFALGYCVFYAPYAAVTKAVTSGLVSGIPKGSVGLDLMPYVLFGTIVASCLVLTLLGWWKYARPFGGPAVVLSGIGTALIIACTTIAYSFAGVSILLALLLMRGGVLIIAPLVDRTYGRTVRWFSWAALALSFAALGVALTAVNDDQMTLAVVINLAGYLSGYCLRLPCMTHCAKTDDTDATLRWLVQELIVAMLVIALLPIAAMAMGMTSLQPAAMRGALAIGGLYALLYLFGTLIYLDRRENTFCVPLNRASSLLAGVVASVALTMIYHSPLPAASQILSAMLILGALLLLSPLHHSVEDAWAVIARRALRGRLLPTEPRILFVCSANTCRSPMAAAIANAELALRHGLPLDDVLRARGRARSAGLAAVPGAAMTEPTRLALGALEISTARHASSNVTRETVDAADVIYCMTSSQREALTREFPHVTERARCLDPHADIADPSGQAAEIYVEVAERLRKVIRLRFDELGLPAMR